MLRLKIEDYKDISLFALVFFSLILLAFNLKLRKEAEKAKEELLLGHSYESKWRESIFMKSLNIATIEQLPSAYGAKVFVAASQPEFYVLLFLTTGSCNLCIESEIQNWIKVAYAPKIKVLALGDSGITKMKAYFHSIDLCFPVYVDSKRDVYNALNVPDGESAVVILDSKQRVIDALFIDFKREQRTRQKSERLFLCAMH